MKNMSERTNHLFQFEAQRIAAAARAEADYHEKRAEFWQTEFKKSVARVKDTASIEIKTFQISNGERADVSVNYGDLSAYRRMQEASEKIHSHRQKAESYRMAAVTYESQGQRRYDLDGTDVLYYRLGGGPREE